MNRKYTPITIRNFRDLPQIQNLSEEQLFEIEVVSAVLPFRTSNYVVEELIDWTNIPNDPIYTLMFPRKEMLSSKHYDRMADAFKRNADKNEIDTISNEIRSDLNPHPAGQMEKNVPMLDGERLNGIQHKYDQTMLFFPKAGQMCHAHCTFCFRWPQFVGDSSLKFAMKESGQMLQYLQESPEITDILFTGGDPMVMSAKNLRAYMEPLLAPEYDHVQTIRIGSKSLGFWPYRFLTDPDTQDILALFKELTDAGKHVAMMAHFNHGRELETDAVKDAIKAIRETGVQIRCQSPIMKGINDDATVWRDMWKEQVRLGMIPYYMFIARDTGAQEFFAVSLERSWEIFREAYSGVSGVGRTVRGPSMSAGPGKVQVLGVTEVAGEKVFALRFLQGRNSDWVHRPFFAKYDPEAIWFDDLVPAFGEKEFFFSEEYNN